MIGKNLSFIGGVDVASFGWSDWLVVGAVGLWLFSLVWFLGVLAVHRGRAMSPVERVERELSSDAGEEMEAGEDSQELELRDDFDDESWEDVGDADEEWVGSGDVGKPDTEAVGDGGAVPSRNLYEKLSDDEKLEAGDVEASEVPWSFVGVLYGIPLLLLVATIKFIVEFGAVGGLGRGLGLAAVMVGVYLAFRFLMELLGIVGRGLRVVDAAVERVMETVLTVPGILLHETAHLIVMLLVGEIELQDLIQYIREAFSSYLIEREPASSPWVEALGAFAPLFLNTIAVGLSLVLFTTVSHPVSWVFVGLAVIFGYTALPSIEGTGTNDEGEEIAAGDIAMVNTSIYNSSLNYPFLSTITTMFFIVNDKGIYHVIRLLYPVALIGLFFAVDVTSGIEWLTSYF